MSRYEITPEQEQLAELVRDLVSDHGSPRLPYDDRDVAIDAELWRRLAELGLTSLSLPTAIGGAGASVLDATLLAEQLGATVAAVPVATSQLAGVVLGVLDPAVAAPIAERLVAGTAVVLVALSAADGFDFAAELTGHGDSTRLTLDVPDLLEAACADVVLVPVERDGGRHWVAVDIDSVPGALARQRSLDQGQSLGYLRLDAAAVTDLGSVRTDAGVATELDELAWTLLAAQATGAAATALATGVDYATQRRAFGQPIGRFQAIKHRMADMLVQVENARSATYNAAWALDGRWSNRSSAAHLAKAVATENAVAVVQHAIQIHGGIGYTWEHDLHLLLRRAKSCELVLGGPSAHFEAIATMLLGARREPEPVAT